MLSGWMDVDLTEHGKEELQALRNSVDYPESDIYFSSPLRRCIETEHILFPDKIPIISDSFKEINFRSMEGHILPAKKDIDDYFASWVKDEPHMDEETLSDVKKRGAEAILSTVKDCSERNLHSALIVMHSGIMRSIIVALFNLEREAFLEMTVPNGLGYIIEFDDSLSPVSYRKLMRFSEYSM